MQQKAVQKVRRKILHHAAAGPPIPTLQSQVWKLDEVRDLLNPRRMVTRELFRPAELEKTLNFSSPTFSGSSRILSRIVTLELLASALQGNTNC
jgi:hypothetical protein